MEILGLGLPELIIIVLILLLLFGAAKLPELGRSIGGFTKEVKKGFEDDKKDTKKSDAKKEDE
jgi:TatA/E family protein of Tat protein translocase